MKKCDIEGEELSTVLQSALAWIESVYGSDVAVECRERFEIKKLKQCDVITEIDIRGIKRSLSERTSC